MSGSPGADGQTIADMLRKADQAMYSAKYGGKGSYAFFSPSQTASEQ